MPTNPDKTTAEDVGAAKAPSAPDDAKSVYTLSRLLTEGDTIIGGGVTLPEIEGAFTGVDGDTEVTVADAKKRINAWKKAPVEQPEHAE